MKKFKFVASALLASTMILSGCGEKHSHTFSDEWSVDGTFHWHAATCEHTDEVSDKAEHKDDNHDHKCDVCDTVMSEHIDSNGDHLCDICGEGLAYVESVSIVGAPEKVTRGQSVTLKANIKVHNGASSEIAWSVDKPDLASITKEGVLTAKANGTVVVTVSSVADSSKKASASINIVDPDWSDDLKATMEEYLGMILPYFEGAFEWSEDSETSSLTAESANEADAEKVIEAYDALEIEKEVGEDYVEYTFPTDDENLVVAVDVYVDEGKAYVDAYRAFKMVAEWPADKIAACLNGYTKLEPESVPAADGTKFGFTESTQYYYDCYVLVYGSLEAYALKLLNADWVVMESDEEKGFIEFKSPKSSLIIDLIVLSDEVFRAEIYAIGDPVDPIVEWPAEEVAAFCEGYTEVEIPAAVGSEFFVSPLDPSKSYGYFGVIQVLGGVCADYLETLRAAGFSVEYDEENDFYFAIKDNLELDIFDKTSYFAIQAAVYVDPTVWPAETIASFLEGHTEVEVPAATGDSYFAQASTGYYYGQVIVYGGVVADYCSTLEGAGFEVAYDETNECYTAHKDDLAIDVYEYPTYMGLGFYTYVAPAAEWPADLVAALLDGKTEVEIPEAEGTSFVVEPLTGFYFGSITISGGDMDAYLSSLESAGFSVVWDTKYQCYVAAKDNLLMDIGANPKVEGEFQMLLYLKAAFPTADVAAAVEALVPGSETVIPEFEAEEYQLQDVRYYIGAFILYAVGDSSLLNEYVGILDEAGWAVGELEEGVYGAVSPAEDIMLQIDYNSSKGYLEVYIMTYTKPSSEWPTDDVAALVESIEADGTVPAADGLSFTCYEAQGYYPPQINVGVEEGTSEAAIAAYIADLKDAGFFLVMSSYGYDYYAEEGKTLALCIYAYDDSEFIIELGCLASPAVKPVTEWPTDAVAAIVESIEAEGSAVPAFEGEGILFNVGSYYLTVNPGANDPEDLLADYCEKLEGLGYFVCGDNYGDPIYALEGETLGISPYYYNGSLCIELMKLSKPAVPAVFPTTVVEAFFDGKTDEVVPAIAAYDFKTSDKTSYLEIQAYGGNVKDYMKVLSDAGWTADYDSSAYYNYATSPEGSIKMTLINYSSYVTLKLEYVPPKLTEWPADAIAEALGEKAKTTLPGITGEGLQFEFTDNGDNSMKLDVYGSTPSAYVSILEDAGFTVTEGSEGDQYWYLLSEDKTVKVQVYDYMSAGQDYFRVKAYGQDPTWTGTSFDPAVVEEALGLSEGFIPAIADGTKFSFTQPSDDSFKVTVETGANYDNFIAALGEAGFEETAANSGIYTKENVTAVVTVLNPITQKYSVQYSVSAPAEKTLLELVQECMGTSESIPMPCDDANAFTKNSDKDCTINVTGGDADAYATALKEAGFEEDTFMSMGGYSSYVKGDITIDIDATGGSTSNFKVYIYETVVY